MWAFAALAVTGRSTGDGRPDEAGTSTGVDAATGGSVSDSGADGSDDGPPSQACDPQACEGTCSSSSTMGLPTTLGPSAASTTTEPRARDAVTSPADDWGQSSSSSLEVSGGQRAALRSAWDSRYSICAFMLRRSSSAHRRISSNTRGDRRNGKALRFTCRSSRYSPPAEACGLRRERRAGC